jgi:hypothetical protein
MRKTKKQAQDTDDAALRRLKRLGLWARAVRAGDRAQLIALIDDIETMRRKLVAECARLDEEMQRAAVRITAMRAYARSARAIRGGRH